MKRANIKRFPVIMSCLFIISLAGTAQPFAPYNLKCEQLHNPVGVEKEHPKFSWQSFADTRDFLQKEYRILVATTPELLTPDKADVWDSGWIASDKSAGIDFQGSPLLPATRYYWTVNIKDSNGKESGFTTPANFVTALLDDKQNYKALWIALEENGEIIYPFLDEPVAKNTREEGSIGQYHMPQFRKEFKIKNKPVMRLRS